MCFEHHRRPAVVHEDAGVVEGELELNGLSRRDRAILVLRRHHGRVEVHRVHHRRGRHVHTGHALVAAICHLEADRVADTRTDCRSRHLVAEGPGAEFHARHDLDNFVGHVQADLLHGRRIERLQRRRHGQRGAGGKGAGLPSSGGDPGRRRREVHRGRVVRIGRAWRPGVTGNERERQKPEPARSAAVAGCRKGCGRAWISPPWRDGVSVAIESRRVVTRARTMPRSRERRQAAPPMLIMRPTRVDPQRRRHSLPRSARPASRSSNATRASFTGLTEVEDGRSSHRGGNPSILEILAQLTLMFLLPPVATLLSTTRALTEAAAVD